MKNFNLFIVIILFVQVSFSQSNILNAESPKDIGVKTLAQLDSDDEAFLEYGFIDDKDVLFSKTVWEIIDLNERVNFPLLYPTDTTRVGQERRPLIHYLIKGIQNGDIPNIYNDGKFNYPKSLQVFNNSLVDSSYTFSGNEIIETFGSPENFLRKKGEDLASYELDYSLDEIDEMNDIDFLNYQGKIEGLTYKYLNVNEDYRVSKFSYNQVHQYMIKGVWYFDKIQSDLRYRPIAIAPITSEIKDKDKRVELFWIFYPDARETLKDAYVFSERNSSVRKSFDELINKRRFNSVIILEENMYEDRKIEEYMSNSSFMQLLESQRIKEKIRNFEHDMWSW